MNAAAVQKFSYDPFDPAVMADPRPYYRVLREHHPVYYLPRWDTFALSRFDDIWDVLDGEDAIITGTLEDMVKKGELKPYAEAALA